MICVEFLPHIIHTYTTYYYFLAVSIKYKDTFFPFRKIFIESMIAQSIIYPRANKKQGKLWDVKLGTGTSPMGIFLCEVKVSNGCYQLKNSKNETY